MILVWRAAACVFALTLLYPSLLSEQFKYLGLDLSSPGRV